jgi:hypothetical protein
VSSEFAKNIGICVELAAENNFLFQAGTPASLNASCKFKSSSRRSISYRELYDVGVNNQDFNLMIYDRSYFQFTENKMGEDIRLAYYPNPYQYSEYQHERKVASELLESDQLTEDEYEQLLAEGDFTCDIPMIRYDLSINQYCGKYHPAAHFHIGYHTENRWPVKRKLTPFAFFLKILMLYYSQIWRRVGDEGKLFPNKLDILYRQEIKNCHLLEDEYFTRHENDRLHFE